VTLRRVGQAVGLCDSREWALEVSNPALGCEVMFEIFLIGGMVRDGTLSQACLYAVLAGHVGHCHFEHVSKARAENA
jgi:hypothetical protein